MKDGHKETIVALATTPGRSALAIVRVSGGRTRSLLDASFECAKPGPWRHGRVRLGTLRDGGGRVIDEATAVVYEEGRSYTGEDMAEIIVHGSPVVVEELVRGLVAQGARPAEAGEFTRRAIAAGKRDLVQAEAIQDLVDAATAEQAHVAARQLTGEVAQALAPLAERALELRAELEASLDFADEEDLLGDFANRHADGAEGLAVEIARLLEASGDAARVREGVRVVLTGPPNAGKSSLFNALLGRERAIVTDEPGTTRDTVEETLVLEGLPLRLTDAAGLGEAAGKAEAEGMRRAREAVATADVIIEVFDASSSEPPERSDAQRSLCVGTHFDLLDEASVAAKRDDGEILFVSSTSGAGLDELRSRLAALLRAPGAAPLESVALATERHRFRAREAAESLERGAALLRDSGQAELAAVEFGAAVRAFRELLGEVGVEELLGRIFSRFCIGK